MVISLILLRVKEFLFYDANSAYGIILQIDQMPLGLPSRDYFLHEDSQGDLEAYHNYMTDVAVILGANRSDAETQLWDIIEFETKLANVSTQ